MWHFLLGFSYVALSNLFDLAKKRGWLLLLVLCICCCVSVNILISLSREAVFPGFTYLLLLIINS